MGKPTDRMISYAEQLLDELGYDPMNTTSII
ncbi:hypothetical protein Salpa_2185 [Sporomusa sp. KB1]|jgi:hypothetical protein|nr:hypothetical protein Salpa_2185 [Sporomusa sp. KB1]